MGDYSAHISAGGGATSANSASSLNPTSRAPGLHPTVDLPTPPQPGTIDEAWQYVLKQHSQAQRGFLLSARPQALLNESTLLVAAPNAFMRQQIETRLRSAVEEQLSDFFHREMHLSITIDPGIELDLEPADEPEPEADDFETAQFTPKPRLEQPLPPVSSNTDSAPEVDEPRLNPLYTFDTFVIGESNRFAHAAAVAVAESPGKSYNPLMIYGETGLGKTHLLHAIGHYVTNYFDRVRVKYVSTEEMTNQFINAISENQTTAFRRIYRDVDVLLIDDIQFLSNKIQTQEEFFHTFNALHNAQKQIVLTSDRPPKNLEALEPRLRSRFEWGLITDIQPPDLETRIAILRKKSIAERLEVPADVLEFVASKIQTNIRELEGALIRVAAYSSLNQLPVNLEIAESVLKDLILDGQDAPVSASTILDRTAAYFSFTRDDLLSESRTRDLVNARQIAMYLCRELTELSLPKIGELFGGKDHTTVMHAYRKIKKLLAERRSTYDQVTELTNIIRQGSVSN